MRRRPARLLALALVVGLLTDGTAALAAVATPAPVAGGEPIAVSASSGPDPNAVATSIPRIAYHPSTALGLPDRGHLLNGVQLPAEGVDYVTWDPVWAVRPNRGWRRWGTDRLVRTFLRVAAAYRAAHPGAPKLVIGDLSRPHGGEFGPRFGGLGHVSHQNGLDIDIYYPRTDRKLRSVTAVSQIDDRLAQDLVSRFVAAGAQYIFVGPSTSLHGSPDVVQQLIHHDDHMHVRIHNPLG